MKEMETIVRKDDLTRLTLMSTLKSFILEYQSHSTSKEMSTVVNVEVQVHRVEK